MMVRIEDMDRNYNTSNFMELKECITILLTEYKEEQNRSREAIIEDYFRSAREGNQEARDTIKEAAIDIPAIYDSIVEDYEQEKICHTNYESIDELIDSAENMARAFDSVNDALDSIKAYVDDIYSEIFDYVN